MMYLFLSLHMMYLYLYVLHFCIYPHISFLFLHMFYATLLRHSLCNSKLKYRNIYALFVYFTCFRSILNIFFERVIMLSHIYIWLNSYDFLFKFYVIFFIYTGAAATVKDQEQISHLEYMHIEIICTFTHFISMWHIHDTYIFYIYFYTFLFLNIYIIHIYHLYRPEQPLL